ncbi:MAG: hypothetical protein KKH28_04185 [Elusimicrobia bacterium]|nr:hypothetical protein [Elusimicrobiota bacterium]
MQTQRNKTWKLCLVLVFAGVGRCAAVPDISVSTPSQAASPKAALPGALNAPGAFEGIIPPLGLKKYDWQADLVFFSDGYSGFPAAAVSGKKGGSGFLLLYSDSRLPDIRNKGAFLRSSGVPVKSVTTEIPIHDLINNSVSTATYTQDLLDEFSTRAQFLTLFYYRRLYENEFMRAGLLLGLPLAWHNYSVVGTLDDNSRFSESGHAFGLGYATGLTASVNSASELNKGLAVSMFLIYNRIAFESTDGLVGKHLRNRLSGLRFGFSAGWRFNFYQ